MTVGREGGSDASNTAGAVTLRGHAYDLEDGILPVDVLSWSSDVGGFLGTGEQLEINRSTGNEATKVPLTARLQGQRGRPLRLIARAELLEDFEPNTQNNLDTELPRPGPADRNLRRIRCR